MEKIFVTCGAFFALAGVISRSLSSHAIHDFLMKRETLENFNLASDYLVLHGLALVTIAVLCRLFPQGGFSTAGWAFIWGSILFQGSVLTKSCVGLGPLGIITPMGGLLLMFAWAALLIAGLRAL